MDMAEARDSEGRQKTKNAQDQKAAQERKAVRLLLQDLYCRPMLSGRRCVGGLVEIW